MAIATREEAHKTFRWLIVTVAVVVSTYFQTFWMKGCIEEEAKTTRLECPMKLKECEAHCDAWKDRVQAAADCAPVGRR